MVIPRQRGAPSGGSPPHSNKPGCLSARRTPPPEGDVLQHREEYMSTFANIWLGLEESANTAVVNMLRTPPELYNGSIPIRAQRIFRFVADQEVTRGLFKPSTVAGKEWFLYNISFEDPKYALSGIRAELDWLLLTYPGKINIAGAWKRTGEQYGTEHVYTTTEVEKMVSRLNKNYQPDPEEPDYDPVRVTRTLEMVEVTDITGMTGTPIYPIPKTALKKFMPTGVLGDIVLGQGQSPRSFF